MKLGIDIDGVLANFTDSYAKHLTAHTGIKFPKNSPEWPTEWYWERAAGVTKPQESYVWANNICQPGSTFWEDLEPFAPNTRMTIKQLNSLSRNGHEVVYITTRMGDKAKYQTERWLYNNGMNFPTVVLSKEKVPLIRLLQLDFFVDDRIETMNDLYHDKEKHPEDYPGGCNYYLIETPYNRNHTRWTNMKVASDCEQAMRDAHLWDDTVVTKLLNIRERLV